MLLSLQLTGMNMGVKTANQVPSAQKKKRR